MYDIDDVFYFNSITDFVVNVKNAKRIQGRENSSEDRDYDFSLTHNIEEAWGYLEEGRVDKTGQKVLENLEKLNTKVNRSVQFNDIVGFVPNVPNYLMGVPQTMVNRQVKIYKDKIVNIVVNTSVSAVTSTSFIIEKATEVLEVILKLEQDGYRVNLYKMIGSSLSGGKSVLGFIKMKDDKERINLKKMMFPLTHPAMQRRLDFYFRECYGLVDVTNDGYGSQQRWDFDFVKKYLKRICAGEFLFANLSNYDEEWYKKLQKVSK